MKISILIPTIAQEHQIADCLNSVVAQLKNRTDVELIILSGKYEFCISKLNNEQIRIFNHPNKSVLDLRAIGLHLAYGKYVAITEDHCMVNNNWISNIESFLDQNIKSNIIGGNIYNGSQESTWDRANFWMTFNNFLATSKTKSFSPCIANLAIRKNPIVSQHFDAGEFEEYLAQKSKIKKGDNIDNPVFHIQSHGTYKTVVKHFHNGKACVGLIRNKFKGIKFLFKIVKIFILPFWLVFQITGNILLARKDNRLKLLPDTLVILILIISHTIGELAGLLFGAGESPYQLD
ncbi:glycosyltransferase family A protein [Pseudoalteromonas sp. SSM20]|uniref:glycosyltransferase family A protein n=1 Tax=Pseudoalteromonas sp. SSM20 TaxID=3139394 RepID=UPI003BA88A35